MSAGRDWECPCWALDGSLFKTFPSIRMAVLVGIGGGIPRAEVSEDPLENIHLGDVVVGWPGEWQAGLRVPHRGRSKIDGHLELVCTMGNPDWRLLNAPVCLSQITKLEDQFEEQLARLQRVPKTRGNSSIRLEHDRLFKAEYHHVGDYNRGALDAICLRSLNDLNELQRTRTFRLPPRSHCHGQRSYPRRSIARRDWSKM